MAVAFTVFIFQLPAINGMRGISQFQKNVHRGVAEDADEDAEKAPQMNTDGNAEEIALPECICGVIEFCLPCVFLRVLCASAVNHALASSAASANSFLVIVAIRRSW